MWRPLNIKNSKYFFSFEINEENQLCFSLTNLVNVWKEIVEKQDAISRFKDCNPKVTLSEELIIEFLEELFDSTDGCLYMIEMIVNDRDNSQITVNISKTLLIKMLFNFVVSKQCQETVYDKITLPLLLIINELKHTQNELCKQLEAKDLHLREFELDGFEITRKNVITSKFKKEEFEKELNEGLEERMKLCIGNTDSIISEDVNRVYPAFLKVTKPVSSKINETVGENNINSGVERIIEVRGLIKAS